MPADIGGKDELYLTANAIGPDACCEKFVSLYQIEFEYINIAIRDINTGCE